MRRHFSFTTVAATVALILSMTGASVAATHYLITSSRQIKPGVIALRDLSPAARRALKGQHGLPGAQGSQGQPGVQGQPGTVVAYSFSGNGSGLVFTGFPTTVAHLTLPAGNWVVTFSTTVRNDDASNAAYLSCDNAGPNNVPTDISPADTVVPLRLSASVPGSAVVTEQGAIQLSSPSTIDFRCGNFGAAPDAHVAAWYTRATAVQTSQIQQTP
jgi:hypothetical protein